jgi:DegV family protein with EDD domain
MTPALKEKLGIMQIPLTMRLGNKEFTDDDTLDLEGFMSEMKACDEKIGSASPAPHVYQEAIEKARQSFVVTLSGKLSGSYNNALMGKKFAQESIEASTHVFDSKSASAGETLIAIKLRELIQRGMTVRNIIQTTNRFIDDMKTYFVLENYDNLRKNGRLGKVTEKLANILNIKLLMGSDGDGNIALYAKPRGVNHMLGKLLSLIKDSGKKTEGENIVISHCNNPALADRLAEAIRQRYSFKEIFVIPTGGLSSLYTDDKGIVMAF